MATIEQLLRDHGTLIYGLLLLYCMLKSGALPLFAGYAAELGWLELGPVIAATLAGGYLGDELRFWLARRHGPALLARWPRWRRGVATARLLMARHGILYLFIYRYPKGMRTIGALPIGLGDMPWRRFTLFNAASALLWSALLIGAGYALGASLADAAGRYFAAVSILLLLIFLALSYGAWRGIVRTLPAGHIP